MTESSHAAAVVFDRFERVVDPTLYQPLPADDLIGMTDVVNSTQAIKEGRYKAVNMAGAAAITAVMNAVPEESFPFVFGGDGATLAVSSRHAAEVRDALARTSAFARDELGLDLRAALDPALGHPEGGSRCAHGLVPTFAGSALRHVFGRGARFRRGADEGGRFAIEPAPAGQRPDLAGLSCRYMPVTSKNGVVLSLIVKRAEGASEAELRDGRHRHALHAARSSIGTAIRCRPKGRPCAGASQGFELEARASRRRETLAWRKLKLAFIVGASWLILKIRHEGRQFRSRPLSAPDDAEYGFSQIR